MAPAVKDQKTGRFTRKSIDQWKTNVSNKQKQVWADVKDGKRRSEGYFRESNLVETSSRRASATSSRFVVLQVRFASVISCPAPRNITD